MSLDLSIHRVGCGVEAMSLRPSEPVLPGGKGGVKSTLPARIARLGNRVRVPAALSAFAGTGSAGPTPPNAGRPRRHAGDHPVGKTMQDHDRRCGRSVRPHSSDIARSDSVHDQRPARIGAAADAVTSAGRTAFDKPHVRRRPFGLVPECGGRDGGAPSSAAHLRRGALLLTGGPEGHRDPAVDMRAPVRLAAGGPDCSTLLSTRDLATALGAASAPDLGDDRAFGEGERVDVMLLAKAHAATGLCGEVGA